MLVLIVNIEPAHHVALLVLSVQVSFNLLLECTPCCRFARTLLAAHPIIANAWCTQLLGMIVLIPLTFKLFTFFQTGRIFLKRFRQFVVTFLDAIQVTHLHLLSIWLERACLSQLRQCRIILAVAVNLLGRVISHVLLSPLIVNALD